MSDLTRVTDVEELALARVVEQFKRADNFNAVLRVFAAHTQALEDQTWLLYTERWLSTADGVQLDSLGWLVGQPRGELSDDAYRLWIQARMLANRSQGHPDDALEIIQLIVPGVTDAFYVEVPPAAYRIEVFGLPIVFAGAVREIMLLAKPAGVSMDFITNEFPIEETFTLSDTSSLMTGDFDRGFGDATDGSVGGHLASVL